MNTLYLQPTAWDLCTDAFGNIAMGQAPYALAQDAASQVQTFLEEVYYDTTLGLPYFTKIYGKVPIPFELIRSLSIQAALTVPEVASATLYFTGLKNRVLTGQLQLVAESGYGIAVNTPVASLPGANVPRTFTLDVSTLGGQNTLG